MAEREQPGEAGQQHQAEPDDGVDQHEGSCASQYSATEPRRGEQQHGRAAPYQNTWPPCLARRMSCS